MAVYPGATVKLVARYKAGGSSCRTMSHVNRYMLHTAVSNASSLYSFFAVPGRATSHFYVAEDGRCEQYIDTRYCSTAALEGNPDSITVETWDGYPTGWANGSDVPRWTDPQMTTLADMAAWAHSVHGVPLAPCLNSRPGTRGVAWHRQGCDPYRVDGGEHWSLSYGKVCPGDRRIQQIPTLISMAKADGTTPPPEEDDDMPLTDEDIEKIAKRVNQVLGDYNVEGDPRNKDDKTPEPANARLTQIERTVRRIEEKLK